MQRFVNLQVDVPSSLARARTKWWFWLCLCSVYRNVLLACFQRDRTVHLHFVSLISACWLQMCIAYVAVCWCHFIFFPYVSYVCITSLSTIRIHPCPWFLVLFDINAFSFLLLRIMISFLFLYPSGQRSVRLRSTAFFLRVRSTYSLAEWSGNELCIFDCCFEHAFCAVLAWSTTKGYHMYVYRDRRL